MVKETIISFEEALNKSGKEKHLLIGNGFSMAWDVQRFSYRSLFEQADFSKYSEAKAVFEKLRVHDFEVVIRGLSQAATITTIYNSCNSAISETMLRDANGLKEILVTAIAKGHPERPGDIPPESYLACRKFLRNFKNIYTLNYDLLLYWALMQEDLGDLTCNCDDGFRSSEKAPDENYVVWDNAHSANVYFLHGALHLFDARTELKKYTWNRTGIALIDQIREALQGNLFPLFVAEGDSNSKVARINHSGYLSKAMRSFSSIGKDLFIYGHSLAESDEHILHAIEKGKINNVFVSIYGEPDSERNQRIIERAKQLQSNRSKRGSQKKLAVHFFEASSADVWGKMGGGR
ncbi:MAG: DUF4917 family protein [Coleofasciculaceae cyanobacterium]